MTNPLRGGAPPRDVADDGIGEANPHELLERLGRRMLDLERQRLSAPTTALRVALDIELCRMEATRRMLCPEPTAEGGLLGVRTHEPELEA